MGSELLAADCEKAWIHTGWEDIVHKGNASASGGAHD